MLLIFGLGTPLSLGGGGGGFGVFYFGRDHSCFSPDFGTIIDSICCY